MHLLAAALLALVHAQQPPPVLRAIAVCSEAKAGMGEAILRFPTGLANTSRLQVTVFARGFERGTFMTLANPNPVRRTGGIAAATTAAAAADADRPVAAAAVVFSDKSSARDQRLPAYRLAVRSWRSTADTTVVTVDGLEEGVKYTWRLATTGNAPAPMATTSGPSCGKDRRSRD